MNDDVSATMPAAMHDAARKTFTAEDLHKIEKVIESAPAKPRPLRAADALAALAPVLRKARERGYSAADLVQLVEQQGLRVSERAISRAMARASAARPARKSIKTVANA